MDVQYVAYWQNGDGTQELLDPDLPLREAKPVRELGVGRLTGTVPPEYLRLKSHSGLPVLREWATAVYVFVDGVLFDAYILTDITDSGDVATLDFVGWLGYLAGIPYRDVLSRNGVPVATAVRELLDVQKDWSGANIGLGYRIHGTFPSLGNPVPEDLPKIPLPPVEPKKFTEKQPVAPKRPTAPKKGKMTDKQYKAARKRYEDALKRYEKARTQHQKDMEAWRKRRDASKEAHRTYKAKVRERESAIKELKRAYDSAAYKLDWWSTHDVLRELQDTLGEVDALYKVQHTLTESGVATHELQVFAERVKRNHRVEFIDGENVMTLPKLTRGGEKQANVVQVLGSGEGSRMVRALRARSAGGRHGLARIATHADKGVRSSGRATMFAHRMLEARHQWWTYERLTVIDSGLAEIGAFDVGDEVLYRTLDRRGFEHEAWVVVQEIEIDTEKGVATVAVAPAGG